MRLGVPVIGAAVDGLVEVLAGERGLAVEPEAPAALAAGIAEVLGGCLSIDLEAGRRYAESFAPGDVAQLYDDAYRHLLDLRAVASAAA
jgi:glycosyltransferase involved in cell wall biosynthesis